MMDADSNLTGSSNNTEVIRHGAAERSRRRGLTIVYTGNGKGKTTAAIGLVVRAAGNRMRVFFLQFIKGQWKSGEREILRGLPGVDLEVTGRGFTIDRLRDPRIPMDEHAAAAAAGWQRAKQVVRSDMYDMVVLDEILGAVRAELVPLSELLELVRTKPEHLHLVLTGRNAPPALIDASDLVSEVLPIKHPFERGIKAQRGVEF
ncbi:MAG TPA: cob(I)yrinic acid a,c-diamide adenosyltransferase [Chloroflexota bacterium]|nr:cob(I)yrinic acid a,c-diamide adenosyltransferase [Chloroflexota bacterium]